MKQLLIPIYPPHFHLVGQFLDSVEKFIIDKENININYITTQSCDNEPLKLILAKYKWLSYKIISIEEILESYSIKESPLPINIVTDKFSYVSIKHWFGARYCTEDQLLIVDSESLIIKSTSWEYIFNNFFSNKIVFSSDLNFIGTSEMRQIVSESLAIVDPENKYPESRNKWTWEYGGWFVEKQLVNEYFDYIEKKHNQNALITMNKTAIFGSIPYWQYIDMFKPGSYLFVNTEGALNNFRLSDFYKKYHNRGSGIIEHLLHGLDESNYIKLQDFVNYYGLNFVRTDTDFKDFNLVKKFIQETQSIKMIVCSENAGIFI